MGERSRLLKGDSVDDHEQSLTQSSINKEGHLLFGKDLDRDAKMGLMNTTEFLPEVKRICDLTLPCVGLYVFQALFFAASLAFVGHLGSLELAGAAIAVTVTNAGGRWVLMGMASGMETLCGQAFGAGQFIQVGQILQRAIVILNLTAVPLIAILFNIDSILLLCGQREDVAAYAALFTRYMIPGLLIQAWSCPIEKFLQAQGLVVPLVIASGLTFVLHVPLLWFMMFTVNLGYIGAAIAISLSYLIYLVILVLWVWYFDIQKKSWHGWNWSCLQRWGEYLSLALPACIMLCLECWCFELATIMVGLLPNPEVQVGALSICLNVLLILSMLPIGLSVAVSTRVSNELGAGNPRRARHVAITSLTVGIGLGTCIATALFVFRDQWALMFTKSSGEEAVRRLAAEMFPYVAVLHLSDCIQVSMQGVLRGSGRQLTGAVVNLVSYYFVALPVAYYCSFRTHLQAKGVWIGLMSGSILQAVSFIIFTLFLDWEEESRRAMALVAEEEAVEAYYLM